MLKIMFSAGEASGDLHAAAVAAALRAARPDIRMFGLGGRAMKEAGVEIIYDIADLGIIGLVEVIRSLPRMFRLRDQLAAVMDRERPDVLVIVDYPGFNLRLAQVAKDKGIPVVSYISPSVWAWGRGRVKNVARTVTRLAAIFPFEADIYREAGVDVAFVGHPALDIVKPSLSRTEAFAYFDADPARPVVLLLPGSRRQEITNLLPPMLGAAERLEKKFPGCQFFLPIASTISREMLHNITKEANIPLKFTTDHIYDLMAIAGVGLATSGTVTLEAALMRLPVVVIYRATLITYLLSKVLLKIPYISLPNIVAGRWVVPELLQYAANPANIAREAGSLLGDETRRRDVLRGLDDIRVKLGETGAVGRVAGVVLQTAAHGG